MLLLVYKVFICFEDQAPYRVLFLFSVVAPATIFIAIGTKTWSSHTTCFVLRDLLKSICLRIAHESGKRCDRSSDRFFICLP